MPTLCFDASFSKPERAILLKTFKSNCAEVGVTGKDATIEVRRVPLGPPSRMGAITQIAPDRFLVLINSNGSLFSAVFALGHETVHFDQHMRGDLVDHEDGLLWKGTLFPFSVCHSSACYESLPWEKEAHEKHDELCKRAIFCLSPAERVAVLHDEEALAA